ncbi:MAG TPA: hypothetical protein VN031_03850, partial [Candidatus Microsaccharimonas sp.]|nr:hypothetical protein [Candidatus Microsaccharimonas sp.]
KKKTKPNIVSWLTWTILTAIATAATFAAHEPRTALLVLASTVCATGVVLAGLRYGIAKFSLFDGLCQAGAFVGLALWLLFNSPTIGIIVPVVIDFVAMLPTLRHAWLKPGEETWQTFLIGTFAPVFTIFSLASFNVNSLLYPLYLLFANGAIVVVVVGRRKQLSLGL